MKDIKLKTVFIGSKKNMFGDYITGQNYYIPTQVDAVISGLQSECENERVLKERALQKVRELEDKVLELNKDNYTLQAFKMEADLYIAHQKRKRCEALADLNWWQANRYSAAEMVERIRWNLDEARQCSKLEEKYLKRYHKWLKLAEHYKEAK